MPTGTAGEAVSPPRILVFLFKRIKAVANPTHQNIVGVLVFISGMGEGQGVMVRAVWVRGPHPFSHRSPGRLHLYLGTD